MNMYIERAEMWESKARQNLDLAISEFNDGLNASAGRFAREAAEALFKADGERWYAQKAAEAAASDGQEDR